MEDEFIEKVHGLQSTSISLNDRFTVFQSVGPARVYRPRKPRSLGYLNRGLNMRNRLLVEQIARRIEHQAKLRAFRHKLGLSYRGRGGMRRYGSQNSLPGLRRANSFGNLSQAGYRNWNNNWRGSLGNLSRAVSYGNLSQFGRGRQVWRGYNRRGGGNWSLRGRFKSYQGRVNRAYQMLKSVRGARGRGRGRGRGVSRPASEALPTREQLDEQLDEYMSNSKQALDRQLEEYMNNATVEMEE